MSVQGQGSVSAVLDAIRTITRMIRSGSLVGPHTHTARNGGPIQTDTTMRFRNALQPMFDSDSQMLNRNLNADLWRGQRYYNQATKPTYGARGDVWWNGSTFSVYNGTAWHAAGSEAAGYVIQQIGSTIYAIPASNSNLPQLSGVDAATVLQQAIDKTSSSSTPSVLVISNLTLNSPVTLHGTAFDFRVKGQINHDANQCFLLGDASRALSYSRLELGRVVSGGGDSVVLQNCFQNLIFADALKGSGGGDGIRNAPLIPSPPNEDNQGTNDNQFMIGGIMGYANGYHQLLGPAGYTADNQGTSLTAAIFNNQNSVVANGILIDSGVGSTLNLFQGVIDMSGTTKAGWRDINEQGGGSNLYFMKFITALSNSVLQSTSSVYGMINGTPGLIFGSPSAPELSWDSINKVLLLNGATFTNPLSIPQSIIAAGAFVSNATYTFVALSSNPYTFFVHNTSGGVDAKKWFIGTVNGSQMTDFIANDANNATTAVRVVTRSGNAVVSVVYPNGLFGIGTTNPNGARVTIGANPGGIQFVAGSQLPNANLPGIGTSSGTDMVINVPTSQTFIFQAGGITQMQWESIFLKYDGVSTLGFGLGPIYGLDNRRGLTATDGAATTLYTTTSGTQLYRLSGRILATTLGAGGAATLTLKWTEGGAVITTTLTVSAASSPTDAIKTIQPDNATAITTQLTAISGVGTTVNVAATVEELA